LTCRSSTPPNHVLCNTPSDVENLGSYVKPNGRTT
jgi:hypothetical protein